MSAKFWPHVLAMFGRFGPFSGAENLTWGPSKLYNHRVKPKKGQKIHELDISVSNSRGGVPTEGRGVMPKLVTQ